jgi:hypothetical protein
VKLLHNNASLLWEDGKSALIECLAHTMSGSLPSAEVGKPYRMRNEFALGGRAGVRASFLALMCARGSRAVPHAMAYDAVHGAFMTLPPYTRIREGQVHQVGRGPTSSRLGLCMRKCPQDILKALCAEQMAQVARIAGDKRVMKQAINTNHGIIQGETVEKWPALPFEAWKETVETLHMWTQIVGKVRLALSPYVNHWWQVPLYVTARGLTTSPIPYQAGIFEVNFDFIDHHLFLVTSDGTTKAIPLISRSVAEFYREVMASLKALGIEVEINTRPVEVQNPVRFEEDTVHTSYDPVSVNRFWHVLIQTDKVMKQHRSHFLGKCSPIHFFWGSFDLALTFFSGRRAPERPGADPVTMEAYSHEVISCGFWPGDASSPQPAFYAYTAPVLPGLEAASIRPASAFYSSGRGEFFLPYDTVRSADAPEQVLLDFFWTTYETGAKLGHWDREALERKRESWDDSKVGVGEWRNNLVFRP